MRVFKDSQGRSWEISLTIGSALRVKEALGVDLLAPESGDPPVLTRLGTDEFLLAEVILSLLSDQLAAMDMNESQMRDSFDGETILAAHKAFYDELVNFFQSRGRRDRVQAILKQTEIVECAIENAAAQTAGIDTQKLLTAQSHGQISGD